MTVDTVTPDSTVVLECGTARCPRCMTYSEYRFLDHGDGTVEYEVRCHACAHVHSEVTVDPLVVANAA